MCAEEVFVNCYIFNPIRSRKLRLCGAERNVLRSATLFITSLYRVVPFRTLEDINNSLIILTTVPVVPIVT